LYQGSVGLDEKLKYIGLRPSKTLEHENPLIREPDFAIHHFMTSGQIEVENSTETVKEKRDIVVEGLKKLTQTQKVDVTGVCVGFGDDHPTHFLVSFVHDGKLVNLKGHVADLDANHEIRPSEKMHQKPDLKVIDGGVA
jgi:hypothetical protein